MPNDPTLDQPAPDNQHIEELISQLSPQELEMLATTLSSDMQNPSEDGGSVANLAQAIESHLASTPEAAMPEAPTEKAAALKFIKSASYIEGFINHAVSSGFGLKQAVDMYDYSLTDTLQRFKAAEESAAHEKNESVSEEKEEQQSNKAYNPEGKKDMNNKLDEIKLAAYYEGVFERAREYGFNDHQTGNLLKAAETALPDMPMDDGYKHLYNLLGSAEDQGASSQSPGLSEILKNYLSAGRDKLQGGLAEAKNFVGNHQPALRNAGIAAGGLGALGLGAYAANKMNKKDEDESAKYASFQAGAVKQGSLYGLTPQQTLSILKSASADAELADMLASIESQGGGSNPISQFSPELFADEAGAGMGEEPSASPENVLAKLLRAKDSVSDLGNSAKGSLSRANDAAKAYMQSNQNTLKNTGIGALGLAGGGALGYAAAQRNKKR